MPPRKIIHLDLDAFFCAVEELRNPSLRGKPFAVGGRPEGRGVVASCSYAARHCGVHSAMPMIRAKRLCKDLVIVTPCHKAYEEASEKVMSILRTVTPLVEQLSIDEAFMDLENRTEDIDDLARKLQDRIHKVTHLPCSLGAATNKLVAKIATDVGKAGYGGNNYPNAITIVPTGTEREFLAPLAVQMLWGVGPKTAERLKAKGIFTIGQVAELPESVMMREFGRNGYDLSQHARGIDNRPVITEYEIKSISQETTFQADIRDERRLIQVIEQLAEQVAFRLRQDGFTASTVRLKLRWSDFSTISRQVTLPQPINQDQVLAEVAKRLFFEAWKPRKPVRLLGVGASNLIQGAQQPSLWDAPGEREQKLTEALDLLRERFGERVIIKGRLPDKKN